MKQDGFTVLFCGASARIAGSVHLCRPRGYTHDYNETPVDGRALHVLKYIRQFHVSPSTVRTSFAHVFHLQAAKQCTKPDRLNRRVAAPAASATVNAKTVTIRAFDGRALHVLKNIRHFYIYPSTVRTAFARVFHRGTPGVRSLQEAALPLSCRVAAPAASATVNVKTVTIRAFDGRALHGLK